MIPSTAQLRAVMPEDLVSVSILLLYPLDISLFPNPSNRTSGNKS